MEMFACNDNEHTGKVIVFAGHYGSGKTNVAINCAIELRRRGYPCAIADLDIVNPYFRTKDSVKILESHGIRLIVSKFAGTNLDAPSVPPEAYSIIDDRSTYSVIDVGGDDRGALVLGRYSAALSERGYEMLFVCNKFRPLTGTPEEALAAMREIEAASSMTFSGIVNNSNIGTETSAKDVEDSFEYIGALSEMSGLPVAFTSVRYDLADKIAGIGKIFPIKIYVSQSWNREEI